MLLRKHREPCRSCEDAPSRLGATQPAIEIRFNPTVRTNSEIGEWIHLAHISHTRNDQSSKQTAQKSTSWVGSD